MERQDEAAVGAPLLEGLLQRISELMGDGASLAAFRFAAFEEGRRIAGGYRGDDLRTLLERLDAVLGHRTRLLEEAPTAVRLRVEGSPMLSSDRPIVQGIALGVLEGALLVNRGRRYTGRITGAAGPAESVGAAGAAGAAGPGAGPTVPGGPAGTAGARAKGPLEGAEPGAVLVELEEAA